MKRRKFLAGISAGFFGATALASTASGPQEGSRAPETADQGTEQSLVPEFSGVSVEASDTGTTPELSVEWTSDAGSMAADQGLSLGIRSVYTFGDVLALSIESGNDHPQESLELTVRPARESTGLAVTENGEFDRDKLDIVVSKVEPGVIESTAVDAVIDSSLVEERIVVPDDATVFLSVVIDTRNLTGAGTALFHGGLQFELTKIRE